MILSPTPKNFGLTRFACYTCFIVQALIINFPPILFITFSRSYGIPLAKITLLVIINFACQFTIDMLSAIFASKLSYRAMVVAANLFGAVGLASLGILPELFEDAYTGLVIATLTGAIGSGFLEVIANPIMQSCPKPQKNFSMGFLHSFYCWGHLGVVLISTLFLLILGGDSWKLLSFAWASIPALNAMILAITPINQPSAELERESSLSKLAKAKIFWLFIFIMMLGGACEQGMAQWVSAFAELALCAINVPPANAKLFGDLLGPCFFALTMALSRMIYPKICQKYDLRKTMIVCSILCAMCYATAAIFQNPFLALSGCGICGISVGIMWPGTLDLAGKTCSFVGTALFAMLSLAGDFGCMLGPSLVGFVSNTFGGKLHAGMTAAVLMPVTLAIILLFFNAKSGKASK